MSFPYNWQHQEANFSKPIRRQVRGGTHITLEIILMHGDQFFSLRRNCIPEHEVPSDASRRPDGMLFFCHGLIRYGEQIPACVKRIVKEQTGVVVRASQVIDVESLLQKKDDQWAITIYVVADLAREPQPGMFGNQVAEVVPFTEQSIPSDFAWWKQTELIPFLKLARLRLR